MKVLIDTSFFYGLYIKKSPNYENAQIILNKIYNEGQEHIFITTNHVVQESYSVFSNRIHDSAYLKILDDLFYGENSFFEILYISADKAKDQEIIKIMKKYLNQNPKKILSFVDASLIFIADAISADAIISFDKHFENILPYY
jgi:predicted nucleic acid-binding protein